jgi:hypothetical protein
MKPTWRSAGAEDSLRAEGGLSLLVRHVESPSGKGFIPVTYFCDTLLESGKVFAGEDSIAYMQAVSRGRRMFERAMKREDIDGMEKKPTKIVKPVSLVSSVATPEVEPATQAQRDTILRLRRTRGFWQKGMSKKKLNDSDLIKLIRQEYFCDWDKLTKDEAGKILDHMNHRQKGFDRAITKSHKGCFTV